LCEINSPQTFPTAEAVLSFFEATRLTGEDAGEFEASVTRWKKAAEEGFRSPLLDSVGHGIPFVIILTKVSPRPIVSFFAVHA
jgi:hypothetical protein